MTTRNQWHDYWRTQADKCRRAMMSRVKTEAELAALSQACIQAAFDAAAEGREELAKDYICSAREWRLCLRHKRNERS